MYDRQKKIDKQSMQIYKQNLQFLNGRYTKYELRVLALLSGKRWVLVSGEIQVMGLLQDDLIRNEKTVRSHTVEIRAGVDKEVVSKESFVSDFVATLTPKGVQFVNAWRLTQGNLIEKL